MARVRRFLNVLNGWEEVAAAQEAHADDLPHLQPSLAKLQELLEQARNLIAQQATFRAGKQEARKQLLDTIRKGQALVDFMRTGARERFGPDSETLVEFGMQPFRGRTPSEEPDAPENPDPEPPPTE